MIAGWRLELWTFLKLLVLDKVAFVNLQGKSTPWCVNWHQPSWNRIYEYDYSESSEQSSTQ